jgi:hypothetical protein
MRTWNVTAVMAAPDEVEVLVPAEIFDELISVLEDLSAAVSYRADRFTVGMAIEEDHPSRALFHALDALEGAGEKVGIPDWDRWDPIKVEVTDWDEFERELEQPTYPPILGIAELAELLDVSKQRASQVARTQNFPEPYAELASGPVWFLPHVQRFIDEWERQPGRPKRKVRATANG